MRSEISKLREQNRKILAQRIIDLEIIGGIKVEKDRPERTAALLNPKISLEALQDIHATVFAILTHRQQPSETTRDQKQTSGDYIQ